MEAKFENVKKQNAKIQGKAASKESEEGMGVEGAEGGEGADDMSLVFNKSAKGAALVGARGAQEYDEMEDEYTAMDREQVDK